MARTKSRAQARRLYLSRIDKKFDKRIEKSLSLRDKYRNTNYIVNPHFEDTTCEGADKSSQFWLDQIREELPNLRSNKKKINFIEAMIFQAHGCLHEDYHKNIITSLKRSIVGLQNSNSIHHLILSLEQEYSKLNLVFVCTCGKKSKFTEETQELCSTCKRAEEISLYWLDKIREEFPILFSSTEKIKFLDTMISAAYGYLQNSYHRRIIEELRAFVVDLPYMNDHINTLEKTYHKKNFKFFCSCESRFNEITEMPGTPVKTGEDQMSSENAEWISCEVAKKRSLFWLDKIGKEFANLSKNKKKAFLNEMNRWAHGCLHDGYHIKIIEALKACLDDKHNFIYTNIRALEKKYHVINNKCVCTCGLGLTEKTVQSSTDQASFEISNSPEISEKDNIGTDLTYEDLLDIFELND